MNKKLKGIIKESFKPPETQHKEQFTENLLYPQAKFTEVLLAQIGYIRKRIWVVFFISVLFAFYYVNTVKISEHIVTTISSIVPFLSLCIISEIYKTTAYKMNEMELACKYNLHKITLMRFAILGTASFLVLLLLVVSVHKNDFGILRNSLYITVPYLLSNYISLAVIVKINSKETIYICAGVSVLISILTYLANINVSFIYNVNFTSIWAIAFIVIIGLFSHKLIQFTKLQEELQWNLL